MGATFTPYTRNWKWYANNAAEPSTQLANENTKPTLTDDSIVRLRVNVCEEGGANGTNSAWSLQYDTTSSFTSPQDLGAAQHWNYADGAATEGSTISGFLLSDTNFLGLYYESGTYSNLLGKDDDEESDFAIQPTANVSAETTYYFRVLIGGTPIPLGGGETYPQVLTAAAAAATNILRMVICT
jgi:hypothetical protein